MSVFHRFVGFLRHAFQKHPIELLLTLGFAGATFSLSGQEVEKLGGYFLLFPCYFSLSYLLRHSRFYAFSLLYIAGGFALVSYVGSQIEHYLLSNAYWGAILIHLIWLLCKDFRLNNRQMIYSIVYTAGHLAISALLAGIVIFLVDMILVSVEFLFNLPLLSSARINTFNLGLFLLCCPLFFLFFEDREAQSNPQREGKLLLVGEVLINFILSPVVIIYTLLVYVYIASIAVALELPKGNLAYVVVPYISLGIFCIALRHLLEKPRWQQFYRYFNYLALPPLGLLWLGIATRISQYGLTEERIFLLAISALISLFVLCSFSQRLLQYRLFSALSIAMIACVLIIFSPKEIATHSQHARFVQLASELNLLDAQQKLKAELLSDNFSYAEADRDKFQALADISYAYIQRDPTLQAFYGEKILDQLGYIGYSNDMPPDYPHLSFAIENADSALDISHYSRYVWLNHRWLDLSTKDEAAKPMPLEFTFEGIEGIHTPITVDKNYFKQQAEQLGIDWQQKMTKTQLDVLHEHRQAFVYVPTTNGGLLVLNNVYFRYVENHDYRGYIVEGVSLSGYFEPPSTAH